MNEIDELKKIIQEVWCAGDKLRSCEDTFGNFLNRAANEIYSQGYRKIETQYKEYLILVYPKSGGQPKAVWWLQSEDELKERQAKLAEAHEEFISFILKVLVMFH